MLHACIRRSATKHGASEAMAVVTTEVISTRLGCEVAYMTSTGDTDMSAIRTGSVLKSAVDSVQIHTSKPGWIELQSACDKSWQTQWQERREHVTISDEARRLASRQQLCCGRNWRVCTSNSAVHSIRSRNGTGRGGGVWLQPGAEDLLMVQLILDLPLLY